MVPRLIVEIELPDYYLLADIPEAFDALGEELTDDAFAQEAESAMQLASENVGVVLAHYSGDDPALCVKAMDGRIVGIRVKR
jgi:hypothetical protein